MQPVQVQAQRFRLISGDIAAISPGRLEIRATSTGLLHSYALATVRSVRRDGASVWIETPAAGVVTLTAQTADDAAALESALRMGILAAPDEDDDAPAPAAYAPPTPVPAPALAPAPAVPADVLAAPPTPATRPAPAQPSAGDQVTLASGYQVTVTPQHIVVRQPGGQVISELPLQQVQAVGRNARTVTLRSDRGEVNLNTGSDVDAARLTGLIDTARAQLAAISPAGPLRVTLQSGYVVTATATGIVVRDVAGSVISSTPLSDLIDVGQSGQAVMLRTRAGQTNLITTSNADADRLAAAITAHRMEATGAATSASASAGQTEQRQWATPAPPVSAPRQATSSGKVPTWVIVVGVIMFLMFISNVFN